MITEIRVTPGERFLIWITRAKKPMNHVAAELGFERRRLTRILKNPKVRVTVKETVAIEEYTSGFVSTKMWID